MTNYNEKFTQIAAQLASALRTKSELVTFTYAGRDYNVQDRGERMTLVDRISAGYMAAHAEYTQRTIDGWAEAGGKGERPATVNVNMALLERLADAVLYEELTDTDNHKTLHNEYPILSDTQLHRRRFGRRGDEDTNMSGETSLDAAKDVAVDGRDYRYPNRRVRTIDELIFVDEKAQIHNRDRAKQYRKDIAPGRLETYNLRDTGGGLTEDFVACKDVVDRWKNKLSVVY